MKKIIFALALLLSLIACQNSSQDEADEAIGRGNIEQSQADSVAEDADRFQSSTDYEGEGEFVSENSSDIAPTSNEQMIIYTGFIDILVNHYDEVIVDLINKVNELNGFVVQSTEYQHHDNDNKYGEITVKIPNQHFHTFMNDVEASSIEVLSKTTEGNDVTEEYVDLQSRLQSKEAVEERLISFMNDAEKTEDLLKISNDLATVQEEIEQIKGRMNYLEHHVAFSTITVNIQEKQVIIPEIKSDQLNTMEHAQKLFMNTINFLLNAGSKLIVFIIGFSPIIIPLVIVGVVVLLKFRRRG